MTPVLALLLLFLAAAPPPSSLDQVRAEQNLEHRAKAAVEYGAVAERNAEAAYSKGDMQAVVTELKNVEESMETARDALTASGKTPARHPGVYKYAELHSRELLVRLGDLKERMDPGERTEIADTIDKVQQIHDAWFDGIMGKKK